MRSHTKIPIYRTMNLLNMDLLSVVLRVAHLSPRPARGTTDLRSPELEAQSGTWAKPLI